MLTENKFGLTVECPSVLLSGKEMEYMEHFIVLHSFSHVTLRANQNKLFLTEKSSWSTIDTVEANLKIQWNTKCKWIRVDNRQRLFSGVVQSSLNDERIIYLRYCAISRNYVQWCSRPPSETKVALVNVSSSRLLNLDTVFVPFFEFGVFGSNIGTRGRFSFVSYKEIWWWTWSDERSTSKTSRRHRRLKLAYLLETNTSTWSWKEKGNLFWGHNRLNSTVFWWQLGHHCIRF